MADQDLKRKFDTTKMSAKELKDQGLENARKAPGQNPGGFYHQIGGNASVKKGMGFTNHVVLSGVVCSAGLLMYYWYLNKKNETPVSRDEDTTKRHPGVPRKD